VAMLIKADNFYGNSDLIVPKNPIFRVLRAYKRIKEVVSQPDNGENL
jgi:hypothetical protein